MQPEVEKSTPKTKPKLEKTSRKRRRRSKHAKKRSIILEYFKKTHEFNVIISKLKPKHTESAKILSKTISKIEIIEESIDKKERKQSIKNLKVKTRSKHSSKSKSKNGKKEVPKLKASLTINEKLQTIKSTKRVLLKTITSKDKNKQNPRLLRSGKKLSKNKAEKMKNSPRTRSQKKGRASVRKEKSGAKRKVISKLVEVKK